MRSRPSFTGRQIVFLITLGLGAASLTDAVRAQPTQPTPAKVPDGVAIPRPSAAEIGIARRALKQFIDSADAETKAVIEKYPDLVEVRPPRANSATIPNLAPFFRRKHEANLEVARRGDVEVLFMGDSITDFWRNEDGRFAGRAVFDKYFGHWKVANFGIAGDTTQGVLYRLQNGEGEGFQPKAVMLMIGTNNIRRNTAAEIAEGIGAVVLELQNRFPKARILLLAVFPRGRPNDRARQTIAEINGVIARLDDGDRVHYLDIGSKFLDDDGGIPRDVMPDGLHPSAKGYEIWAQAVKEPLTKLFASAAAGDASEVDQGDAETRPDSAPGPQGNGKHTVGPDYKIDPDLTDLGNPGGKSFEFSMRLADSKIFRGDDATLEPDRKAVRKERKIFVYVPAAYQDGDEAPVLVIHDGPGQLRLVSHALDNLTRSKDPKRRLPAFIVVAVQNGGNDGKNSERGLEYDTMSDRLARFINDEVFPAVLKNAAIKAAYPGIAFTDDPWGRAVMGCSSGGAAALTMAWFRPDLFRRVIAYSGTFVDQQDDDAPEEAKYPLGAWEYHSGMKLIETSAKKPLRIFTHVSDRDLRFRDPEETHHNWVMAGQRTAAALEAKGYDHRFVFSLDTRHCDRRVFEQTLADTLVWVWRGYTGE